MSIEKKIVLRNFSVDEATMDSTTIPRQLSAETNTKKLGIKSPAGELYTYPATGTNAEYSGMKITDMAGIGDRPLAVDESGNTKIYTETSGQSKRDIVHGFVDPDGVVFAFDDATRTITYTHPSGYVELWSGGSYYKHMNGDSRLSVQVSNTNNHDWLSFDIDGQLKYKTSLVWVDVKTVCLGHIVKYDPSIGAFILTVSRVEDCQANNVENYASYRTKGLQGVRGEGIDFTGSIGDTTTGFSASRYFSSRDHEIVGPSANDDAVTWLRYYYDGLDSVGDYNTKLSPSPAPTGTPIIIGTDVGLGGTNAVYNIYDDIGDTFTFAECPSNDFAIGHIGFGDGGSQKVVAFAPQGKYSTLGDAQDAIEGEEKRLTNNNDIFRDVAVVASYIVKGNLSGGFLDADKEGNPFYIHSISAQGGGGGGVNNQGLDDVLTINPSTDKTATFSDGTTTTTITPTTIKSINATRTTYLSPTGVLVDNAPSGGTDATYLSEDAILFDNGTEQAQVGLGADGAIELSGETKIDQTGAENSASGALDDTTAINYAGASAGLVWANVTPATGYTLDPTNPMQYAINLTGDLVIKGRLAVTAGAIDTTVRETICAIPPSFSGVTTMFGRMQYNTTANIALASMFITSNGVVDRASLSAGGAITCSTIVCESTFIRNRT